MRPDMIRHWTRYVCSILKSVIDVEISLAAR